MAQYDLYFVNRCKLFRKQVADDCEKRCEHYDREHAIVIVNDDIQFRSHWCSRKLRLIVWDSYE